MDDFKIRLDYNSRTVWNPILENQSILDWHRTRNELMADLFRQSLRADLMQLTYGFDCNKD